VLGSRNSAVMGIEIGKPARAFPFCLRPPIPGAADREMIWGSVLGSAGVLGAGWLRLGLPTPLCPFHALTGIPCPSCGTTRAAGCLLRGDFAGALEWNPLGTLLLGGALLYVAYAAIVSGFRLRRVGWCGGRGSGRLSGLRLAAVLLLGLNWLYLITTGRA